MKGRSLSRERIHRIVLSVTRSVEKPFSTLPLFPLSSSIQPSRGLEKRVPIFPLVMENRKGVETRRLRLEMPFAEKGRLIPSLLHAFRNIVQSRIEPVFKRIDPVMMAIGACHDSRAAWDGDRVRAKAVVKHAPLGRQAADILVLHVFAQYSSIDSPRLRGMIVGKDEKDVRASRVGLPAFRLPSQERQTPKSRS